MTNRLRILHIEDDVIEVMKLNKTINTLKLNHEIIKADNGEQALEILHNAEQTPDIILLDLNIPKLNGIEFLKILKNDQHLKYIPIIILTTSSNPKDLLECYKTGISGYILKPLKYEDYILKIERILNYWSTNELIKG
jgi:CheY-like chemotaxis protein